MYYFSILIPHANLVTFCIKLSTLAVYTSQGHLFMPLLISLTLQILAFIQFIHSFHFWNSIWYFLPYSTKKLTLYCWDQQRSSCLIQTQLPLLGMLQAFCQHMQIYPFFWLSTQYMADVNHSYNKSSQYVTKR